MTDKEKSMRQIAAYDFAQWELHTFLDTHPNACDAARKLAEVEAKKKVLIEKYESKYGPIEETSKDTNRWAWVAGPWPWEREAND